MAHLDVNSIEPGLLEDITHRLESKNLDCQSWPQTPRAKRVHDLAIEIAAKESVLIETDHGFIRETHVVKIKIEHSPADGSPIQQLVEDRQEFSNGNFRRRPTEFAVWEKMGREKDPTEEAYEGIDQELGIKASNLEYIGESQSLEPAEDYPNIPTAIFGHEFKYSMPVEHYSPCGYREAQVDKTTHFKWRNYSEILKAAACQLFALSIPELRQRRIEEAARCHYALKASSIGKSSGVILAESFTQGKVAEALSSFDGSSKYLRGALSACSDSQALELASFRQSFTSLATAISQQTLNFAGIRNLPGDQLIANYAFVKAAHGIEVAITNNSKQELLFLERKLGSSLNDQEFIESAKEIVAILNLMLLAEKYSAPTLVVELTQGDPKHLMEASNLRQFNKEIWTSVKKSLSEEKHQIIVGESFTFGKLANLFSNSSNQESTLRAAYGWYDPSYKAAVGVKPEMLSDEKIAEPETVIQGARGLFKLSPNATVAIGTSGWANNSWLGDKIDFFSVACAFNDGKNLKEKALKYTVNSTANSPIDFARRDLTRELGVSASLYLLVSTLGLSEEICNKLRQQLLAFGNLDIEIS